MFPDFYTQGYNTRQGGNIEGARLLYRAQLRLTPRHAAAANSLAESEIMLDHAHMALALAKRATAINDKSGNHWGMLGSAYCKLLRFQDSIECFRRGVEVMPEHPKLWHNLGIALYSENQPDLAAVAFEQACKLAPNDLESRSDLGMAYLAMGNLQLGLQHFEARWGKLMRQAVWELGVPEWQGEPLSGKTIIHHHEQGYGDTIQFLRYAEDLWAHNARVIVAVPPPLVRLARTIRGVAEVVPYDRLFPEDFPTERLKKADFHSPMTSTPRHLGVTYERMREFGSHVPYLSTRKRKLTPLSAPPGTRLRVGIVWSGRPGLEPDKERSAPLHHFLTLTEHPEIQLYSLQKGARSADLATTGGDALITDLESRMGDWADTAELMQRLDLVISVDTAPAHLAGALGIPVIVITQYARCWRWLRDREDTPWYPSMTVVSQPARGDWDGAMRRVKQLVAERIDGLPE